MKQEQQDFSVNNRKKKTAQAYMGGCVTQGGEILRAKGDKLFRFAKAN